MVLTIILISISFLSYSIMWKLQFHFHQSIFKNLDKYFWNPIYSWQNKYKKDLKTPAFPGSTTIFVFITDGFHLFQFFAFNSLFLALSLHMPFTWWINFLGLRALWFLFFHIPFEYLLKSK